MNNNQISFISICFFIFICINFNFTNGLSIEVINSKKSVQSLRKSTQCSVQMSILLKADQLLNRTEMTLGIPGEGISPIDQIDLSKQLFIFSFLTTLQTTFLVLNIGSFNQNFDPIICVQNREPTQFSIVDFYWPTQYGFKDNLNFYLSFNFTKEENEQYISCRTDSNITCACVPENNIFNLRDWECNLKLNTGYTSLDSNMKVYLQLISYNQSITLTTPNPFPWNVIRRTIFDSIVYYPPNMYTYKQDYRLQSGTPYTQILSLKNLNSIVTNVNETLYLISKNSTHMQFFSSINSYATKSYILDSSSNLISSYETFFTPIPVASSTDQTNITIGNFIFLTFGFKSNFINDYDFSVKTLNQEKYLKLTRPNIYQSNSDSAKYSVIIPVSNSFTGEITGTSRFSSYTFTMNPYRIKTVFSLHSVSFQPSSPTTNIITFSFSTNVPILLMRYQLETVELVLISGDEMNGVYQAEIKPTLSDYFRVYLQGDLYFIFKNNDLYVYYYDQPYNGNFQILPIFTYDISKIISIMDLSYFKFNKTEIDLSYGPVDSTIYNTLYFNFSKYIPDMIPYISFDANQEIKYYGVYDYSLKMFSIEFPLKSWMIDGGLFTIGDTNRIYFKSLESNSILTLFPNSKMNINNPGGTLKPPMLNKLLTYTTNDSIGWKLDISDGGSGFKSGIARVVSERDLYPYIINFNSSNRIEGNEFNGTYDISIQLPFELCKTRVFTLDYLELRNDAPLLPNYNPLQSIKSTQYQSNINITFCNGREEYIFPNLFDISFKPTVQVGGYDRSVEINFTTSDTTGSGISLRHTPIIHLTADTGDHFELQSEIILDRNSSGVTYRAIGQLPYKFGSQMIFVSIYGIVDNQLNYYSYSTLDLLNKNFLNNMTVQFDMNIPFIENSTRITSRGGSLTIYGKAMISDKAFINYQDGKGDQVISPSFNTGVNIQFQGIQEIKSEFFTIQVVRNGVMSNVFKIYPIQPFKIPPPKPSTICPGTPPCNNRGTCNDNLGCQCQSPWYGPSCESELIIIPPLTPQPEPTSNVNITDKESNSVILSSTQIIEVREIDSQNEIVERFSIEKWNFTDLTAISNKPTFVYTSHLNSTSKTMIKSTITFYQNKTDIQFGTTTLTMQPSTIKYTIELEPHQFKSSTNYLQIVMESTISSSNDRSCSSSQFGSKTNTKDDIQWIKLDIDKTSLYGKFIDFGLVDGRATSISNRIIDQGNNTNSNKFRSMKIGITVPYYEQSVYLDPDFSNLISVDPSENQQCASKSKNKISTGAIIGIVVGCVGLALIIGLVLALKKRVSYKIRMMSIKLKKVNPESD